MFKFLKRNAKISKKIKKASAEAEGLALEKHHLSEVESKNSEPVLTENISYKFADDNPKNKKKIKTRDQAQFSANNTMSGFEDSYNPSININPGFKNLKQANLPEEPKSENSAKTKIKIKPRKSTSDRQNFIKGISGLVNDEVIFKNAPKKQHFVKEDDFLKQSKPQIKDKKFVTRSIKDFENPGAGYTSENQTNVNIKIDSNNKKVN